MIDTTAGAIAVKHTITGEDYMVQRPRFVVDDGGRAKYFEATKVGDCGVRAIAIATETDYMETYKSLSAMYGKTARNGTPMKVLHKYMASIGWTWTATMRIGQGCKVHLTANELPSGRLVARVTRHLVAVVDGVIHDTHDCSRGGTRCVYGYWRKDDNNTQGDEDGQRKRH